MVRDVDDKDEEEESEADIESDDESDEDYKGERWVVKLLIQNFPGLVPNTF